jgi:hypothetical protein
MIATRREGLTYELVSVEDSGIGISAEMFGKIFDPFWERGSCENALGLAENESSSLDGSRLLKTHHVIQLLVPLPKHNAPSPQRGDHEHNSCEKEQDEKKQIDHRCGHIDSLKSASGGTIDANFAVLKTKGLPERGTAKTANNCIIWAVCPTCRICSA